ncbi:MAG: pyridoxamine 5'-phosphate oxidase family protein [Oscillospiraceae bacterium]|jgi:uncharacterized pyridoxamine 5'-phosphate oxidase family protein|nr:pyridoxamine 5'-phosphate oxidase family protein [Oscillospiraceae bacterium]MDD3260394.1 pyridoxamine 5'-phosphate oxidase family protein [Oscillospiraceae bacterium]
MNEAVTFLKKNPVQYLATVGRDGKAKVRPFMFSGELGGKLWFCTNDTKEVYREMQENPDVEVCTADKTCAWLRLSGKAVFCEDRDAKEMCMKIPMVKGIYHTADNPIFKVFYLENAHAVLADFSGNPPKAFAW